VCGCAGLIRSEELVLAAATFETSVYQGLDGIGEGSGAVLLTHVRLRPRLLNGYCCFRVNLVQSLDACLHVDAVVQGHHDAAVLAAAHAFCKKRRDAQFRELHEDEAGWLRQGNYEHDGALSMP
jgi:hypothetical protein